MKLLAQESGSVSVNPNSNSFEWEKKKAVKS